MQLVFPQLMCSCGAHIYMRRQDYPVGVSPKDVSELFDCNFFFGLLCLFCPYYFCINFLWNF
jgi:hypothetical protein